MCRLEEIIGRRDYFAAGAANFPRALDAKWPNASQLSRVYCTECTLLDCL